ncbi:hypothetical protein IL306_000948 [Fusarium sp. DS 682]|nr:hypothetical protein IL306_000948 [Fusarium sp. DS 682]
MTNFSDLPWEIRDEIWKLVLRDDHPGVHIFGHYDEKKKGMAEGRSMMHGSHFSGILSEPPPHRYFKSLHEYRDDENISTYLIDGAMWTICKESRLVIEKHFSQYKWPDDSLFIRRRPDFRIEFPPTYGYPYKAVFQVPSTGYFQGSSPHYLTVFPRRDLFVFQPDTLDDIDWYFVGSSPTRGGMRPPFRRLQHIAIEYNPEWWDEICNCSESWDSPNITRLKNAVFELKDSSKLWFIDNSLKRKKDAPVFKEMTSDYYMQLNAFYARDRKFLEVNCFSNYDPLQDWEYAKPVGGSSNRERSFSVDFVQRLRQKILEEEKFETVQNMIFRARARAARCDIGLLGWQEL